MSKKIFKALVFLFILHVFTACAQGSKPKQLQTRLEYPSYSTADCIIEYLGYTVSYNESLRIPNWVAYCLTADETNGYAERKGKSFRPDEKAKKIQADNDDYKKSGWSRGHMAPAGDFKWDEQAMWTTFYYTNCCPQDEKLNNGSWNLLENKVRTWARQFGSIYVVTGPIVGQNKNGKIGSHQITIPDAFFKALLVYTKDFYQGIAFVMTNDATSQRLTNSYMSINELERVSGLDFFPSLDDTTEEKVEEEVDVSFWNLR